MDKKIDEKVANFFKDFDEDFCRQYILEKDFEAYQKLKSSLDKMMTNTFIFDDNWDMEPCSTPYHLDPLSWDRQVSEDKEWNYMLNRQGYLMKFILVYLVEKDSRYLDKVKYFIFHWIDCHYPLKADSLVSRTLDTGIRSFTWLKVILYLLYFEAINQEELDKIIRSLAQQLTFLQENYKAKYSLSNWGILQITAILACLFYFEKEINLPHLKVFAETELEEQLRLQILDDGSQYEQSIMYHVEVYRALLDLAVFAPEYKPQLETKLEEMAYYIYMMTGSDHCQLAFGDSDVTDTRDILTASAIFFQSKVLKSYAYPYLDRESLLLFGKKGVAIFEKLESVEPASIEANHFASSGHICHRDSRRYLFFKCGPFGSAHSHSDLNSFCLYDQGKPIFIDPGRFTYQEEKRRYHLKSAKSHSTCFLRDCDSEEIRDSWTYDHYPEAEVSQLVQRGPISFIEGIYQSNTGTSWDFRHKRWILALPDGITLIFDSLTCPGKHELQTQFILDEQVTYSGQELNNLKVISPKPLEAENCFRSQKYNQLTETILLKKVKAFDTKAWDWTLLVDKSYSVTSLPLIQTGSEKIIEEGFGWEIKGEENHYLIAILPTSLIKGDKLYRLKGHKCRGKVVVYDKKHKKYYCLKS